MLASFPNLHISEIVGEEVAQGEVAREEVQPENVDKVKAFIEWFLGDVYGYLAESTGLNIEFVEQDDRCVPKQFYSEMISFSKIFIDKLTPDFSLIPVLLFHSELFFSQFSNSVCLKLIKGDDPEVDFLKVMAFLLVIIYTSFKYRCYCPLDDDIPRALYMLLEHDLITKFYDGRFDDILLLLDKLKKDEKWYESTVEEIRGYMKDTLDTELATKFYDDPFRPDITRTKISDVKSMLDGEQCPYCETDCIFLLKGIWKPKLDNIAPECPQM